MSTLKQIWVKLSDEKPDIEVFAVLSTESLLGTLKPYPEYNNFMFFHQRDNFPVGTAQGEIDPAHIVWLKAVLPNNEPKEQPFTKQQIVDMVTSDLSSEYSYAEIEEMLKTATLTWDEKSVKAIYDNGMIDNWEITLTNHLQLVNN